jgi:hypothetical protein
MRAHKMSAPVDLLWLAVVLAAFGVLASLVPCPPTISGGT